MAATDLSGFAGSVTLPSTHGGDAKGFTVQRTMADKDVGRYASGSRFNRFRGGVLTLEGVINIFLRKGAAATSPNFVAPAVDGAALVLTLDVGCTLTGTALFPGLNVNHAFNDPAIEGAHNYKFTDTVAEVWASGP